MGEFASGKGADSPKIVAGVEGDAPGDRKGSPLRKGEAEGLEPGPVRIEAGRSFDSLRSLRMTAGTDIAGVEPSGLRGTQRRTGKRKCFPVRLFSQNTD